MDCESILAAILGIAGLLMFIFGNKLADLAVDAVLRWQERREEKLNQKILSQGSLIIDPEMRRILFGEKKTK